MVDTLRLARALLQGDSLVLRQLSMDALDNPTVLMSASAPSGASIAELAAAASLIELFCERSGVTVPPWASVAPSLPEPIYVVRAALQMPRLRVLCETEGPIALRKRGFLAPPGFLTFA